MKEKRDTTSSYRYRARSNDGEHSSCVQSLLKEEHSDSDSESEGESDYAEFMMLQKVII